VSTETQKAIWDKAMSELPPMRCGRLDMASYDGETGEMFKNVYIGEDVTVTIKGPFCDHVAYAAGEYQALRAENKRLVEALVNIAREPWIGRDIAEYVNSVRFAVDKAIATQPKQEDTK